MRVMVTGHRGYIGPFAVQLLREKGHEVVGYDSGLFSDCSLRPLEAVPAVEKDIRDAEPADFTGVDAVIHLAALSNDPLGEFDAQLTTEINCNAAIRVAESAKKAGVARFGLASTCSVYGAQGDDLLDETSSHNPVTPYARSKLAAEEAIRRLADATFSPVFLRPGTAYGAAPVIRFDLVVNNLTAWAIATQRVNVKGDGVPWRPLVHAQDIARAFVAAITAPKEVVHNEAFNVGASDANYRIKEIADIVAGVVPDSSVFIANVPDPDKRSYRVNFDKIKRVLTDWTPGWNVATGAKDLYDTIQSLGLKTEDFEGARFNRLPHLKQLIARGLLTSEFRWVGGTRAVSA
jgi:nucleoside-diphosphate-sugar epimerase